MSFCARLWNNTTLRQVTVRTKLRRTRENLIIYNAFIFHYIIIIYYILFYIIIYYSLYYNFSLHYIHLFRPLYGSSKPPSVSVRRFSVRFDRLNNIFIYLFFIASITLHSFFHPEKNSFLVSPSVISQSYCFSLRLLYSYFGMCLRVFIPLLTSKTQYS